MNPYMAYEAVDTKIASKKRNIFDRNKLDKMLECNTVEQVTEFLRSKYNLRNILSDSKGHALHRDDLETLLKRYRVTEIENLLHYFSGPYKDFLQGILMEYEISDLIMILRKMAKGESSNGIERNYIHSEQYSSLNYEKLAASRNIAQFMDCLKNTPYYNFIKTMTFTDVIKMEFHMEMKLQSLLYRTLLQNSLKLNAEDQRTVNEIIGLKIDFLNVQWIYRARKYYNISPEQILIYCLRGGYKLSFERLQKLCYSKTTDEIRKLSNEYLRYHVFTSNNEADIERNIDFYIYIKIKERNYRGTIGFVLLYLYRLEIIIKDLITITEGIRYKLPKEDLKKYLVHS